MRKVNRNRLSCLFLFSLLLGSYCFFLPYTDAAGTAHIDRLKIEERPLPGETAQGNIQVTNYQNEIMRLKVYLQDWGYAPEGDGSKNFAPAGLMPYTCSPWIQIHPEQLTIPPNKSANIHYTLTVPKEAKGGYHSVIFFENILGERSEGKTKTVSISVRTACLFFVEVRGTVKREGIVQSVLLSREEGSKSLDLKLSFENTGNTHLSLEPMFDLMNLEGALVARGTFPKIYTLPENKAVTSTTWLGKLAEGVYNLILTIDLGENQVLVKEWKVKVSSTGAIHETLS